MATPPARPGPPLPIAAHHCLPLPAQSSPHCSDQHRLHAAGTEPTTHSPHPAVLSLLMSGCAAAGSSHSRSKVVMSVAMRKRGAHHTFQAAFAAQPEPTLKACWRASMVLQRPRGSMWPSNVQLLVAQQAGAGAGGSQGSSHLALPPAHSGKLGRPIGQARPYIRLRKLGAQLCSRCKAGGVAMGPQSEFCAWAPPRGGVAHPLAGVQPATRGPEVQAPGQLPRVLVVKV